MINRPGYIIAVHYDLTEDVDDGRREGGGGCDLSGGSVIKRAFFRRSSASVSMPLRLFSYTGFVSTLYHKDYSRSISTL